MNGVAKFARWPKRFPVGPVLGGEHFHEAEQKRPPWFAVMNWRETQSAGRPGSKRRSPWRPGGRTFFFCPFLVAGL